MTLDGRCEAPQFWLGRLAQGWLLTFKSSAASTYLLAAFIWYSLNNDTVQTAAFIPQMPLITSVLATDDDIPWIPSYFDIKVSST